MFYLFFAIGTLSLLTAKPPNASCGTDGTSCSVHQTCQSDNETGRCTSSNCDCSCTWTGYEDGIPTAFAMIRTCSNALGRYLRIGENNIFHQFVKIQEIV